MQTIRRTRERRFPLLLKAEHEDRGPYYLVDRAGYGVSWRKPAYEHIPTESRYQASYAGATHTRRLTWVPIFARAKLAFTLVDDNEEVDAKLAKKIADKTYDKLGFGRPMGEVERYAYYLLKKTQKTPSRDPKRTKRTKRTNKVDTTNAALVREYAIRYATNVGLRPVFPRLVVGMMAELQGWPVRNADGGANIAHFTTVEAAEAAITAARRAFRDTFNTSWSGTG